MQVIYEDKVSWRNCKGAGESEGQQAKQGCDFRQSPSLSLMIP